MKAAQVRQSLHLSKCHIVDIVGNHMSRLKCGNYLFYIKNVRITRTRVNFRNSFGFNIEHHRVNCSWIKNGYILYLNNLRFEKLCVGPNKKKISMFRVVTGYKILGRVG